nr:sodium/calcium exchanger 3-like [Oncorhynchus nerka]
MSCSELLKVRARGRQCKSHEEPCQKRPCQKRPCRKRLCQKRPCQKRPCQKRPCQKRPCRKRPCQKRPCQKRPCQKRPCQKRPCQKRLLPEEALPEEPLPKETLPEESLHEERPCQKRPCQKRPCRKRLCQNRLLPEEALPEEPLPKETLPEEAFPEESLQEEAFPEESQQEEAFPEEALQEEAFPEEALQEEAFPEESLLIEGKEVDESRRDMIRILKDLKQKHPEKEMDQLVEMANYYALSHQQKSRAFYRIQATRMMTGAGNILKKHVAEQTKRSASIQEVCVVGEEVEEYVSRIAFEPAVYQCLENCGAALLAISRKGGDMAKTIYVDYKTEDGSANAGADYEFTEGTVVFKPGEFVKEISVGIIDDDIFEEDEHFFVRLSNVRVLESDEDETLLSPNSLPYPKALLGFPAIATVTILDDDHAGIFTFETDTCHVSESVGVLEVKVLRTSGARGTVIVPYRTMEGIAKGGGEDFEDTYGELEFRNDETW